MLLGGRPLTARPARVTLSLAAVVLIVLGSCAAAPTLAARGATSPATASTPISTQSKLSNAPATPSSPDAHFAPTALAQSTFAITNDTLASGNQQPSTAIGSDVVAAALDLPVVLVGTLHSLIAVDATSGLPIWSTNYVGVGVTSIAIDAEADSAFIALSGNYSEILEVALGNGSVLDHTYDSGWQPIAFDPISGLVYEAGFPWMDLTTYNASNLSDSGWLPSYSGGDFNPAATELTVDPVTGYVFVVSANGFGDILSSPNAGFAILSPHNGSIVNETYVCGPATAGPLPVALAYDSRNGTVFVLCTNETGAFLSVQSGATSQNLADIPLPMGALGSDFFGSSLAYLPASDQIVFGNDEGGLTMVNATSYRISGNSSSQFDGGATGVLAEGGPASLVYSFNPYGNTLNAYTSTASAPVFSRQLDPMPLAPTFVGPLGELWVAGAPNADTISIINTTVGRTVGQVTVGLVPDAMAYDAAHSEMWVANALSRNLSVVNAITDNVVGTVPLGGVPVGVVAVPTEGEIFVVESSQALLGNPGPSTVAVFNDTTLALETTVNLSLPAVAYNNPNATLPTTVFWDSQLGRVIIAEGYQFWVSSTETSSGFWSLDPTRLTNRAYPTSMDGAAIIGLGYDPSTGGVYAAGWLNNTSATQTLWKLDPTNGSFEQFVGNLFSNTTAYGESSTGAFGSIIVPLSGTSWVAAVVSTGAGYRLSLFNGSAFGGAVASYPLGSGPISAQWDPTADELYVANYQSDSLSWFDPSPRATVALGATVRCGDFPEVAGVDAGPTVALVAPGNYSLGAVDFCGSSAFSSWGESGGVSVTPQGANWESAGFLSVDANGSVAANYLTEPPGLYPVVLREQGLPTNTTWVPMVGSHPGIGNGPTVVLAVANGTYLVSVAPVSGYTASVLTPIIVVDGVGTVVNLSFTHSVSTGTQGASLEWWPLAALFVAFAIAGAPIAVVVRRRGRSGH